MSSLSSEDILKAATRIKPYIRRTPLEYSPWLSDEGKSKVYVKLGELRKLRIASCPLFTQDLVQSSRFACGAVLILKTEMFTEIFSIPIIPQFYNSNN